MSAAPGPEGIRKAVRDRILNDMLGSIQDPTGGGWRVLILDAFTTKLLGAAMRMSDVLDQNVSVVEDINRVRQPMQQAAVYFIQPSPDSITCLLNDFSKGKGLYPSVHIFFTGKVTTEGLNRIKSCERLIAVVRTLKESNIELIVVDSRTFVTDHDDALVKLMGERAETSKSETDRELAAIATRLATAFTTLNEFPSIRYQVGKPPDINDPPGQATRALLCQKLGNELLRRLGDLQREGKLPPKETCDVLVLDRSYDALAPVMHEWTYESMVYDLLYDKLDGNIFKYQSENQAGKVEERVVTIGEHDSIWVELRHAFVADLYKTLATRMSEFQAKDKAARAAAKDGLSGAQIKALIQSQPQNRDILSRLATHVELSAQLRAEVKERDLMQLGELEQDLVFGEKNSKDLISYLQQLATDLDESAEVRMEEDKMRLLMAYLATHPGKMDATKKAQWMKLAKISPQAMDAVCNLAFLGVNIMAAPPEGAKSSKSFFGSGSKAAKAPKSVRKKKQEDATVWACFDPLLMDILTDMVGGRLSQDEFPYVRPPQDAQDGPDKSAASSARSARSGLNWARGARGNAGGAASGPMRRLIVFIIGGCTRSESRIAHVLSKQLGRDVILGSTNMLSPAKFINVLPLLGTLEE